MDMASLLEKIPQRSHWHALEPIGLGSPMAESLTSYLVRVAWSHLVQVSTSVHFRATGLVVPYSSQLLNGLAGHARKWVGVVQEKTGRKDLRLTTCLPLQGAISPQGLLVSWQRWCPICYQVWSKVLVRELHQADLIYVVGKTSAARWYAR